MIRKLEPKDAEAFVGLRQAALTQEPLSFTSSPTEDRFASPADFASKLDDGPDWVVFGAFAPELVGIVGAMRGNRIKTAHRVHVWGMYVSPAHRGRGVAAALLDAVIVHARTLAGVRWITLGVSSAAPAARRLYERAGFEAWGAEPDALRHQGETADEIHMALRIA